HSFRLIIADLYDLGLIKMREVGFFPSEGCEFHIALSRNGTGSKLNRLELLREVNREFLIGSEANLLVKTGLTGMRKKTILRLRTIAGKGKWRLKKLLGGTKAGS
nr:hypothetical protein [Blastocatellia bacterium]